MQPDSNVTRASLISRAKSQDSQAWGELVDLYGPLIAHWCYRCGMNPHQTADEVQEVFTAVAKSLRDYKAERSHGSFRAWLWTITSNKIKDHYRRNQNQVSARGGSTALAAMEQLAEPSEVPEAEPTDSEQISALVSRGLEQVRAEFEPRTWDIFRRSVVDQIPTTTVAQEFCITAGAVRQVRSRVLRRLRQQLGDLEVD
ncbi:MAG: sigma-70 family RNA polymerase sigma factor [Planctomycetota bacterium]